MDNKQDAYTMKVAELLTKQKDALGITFDALADRTGFGRATVVRLLAGERAINLRYLRTLCAALNLDMLEILDSANKHV